MRPDENAGRRLLFTGSYNWSASAETLNYENALFVTGATTIQKYQAEFDRLWRDQK